MKTAGSSRELLEIRSCIGLDDLTEKRYLEFMRLRGGMHHSGVLETDLLSKQPEHTLWRLNKWTHILYVVANDKQDWLKALWDRNMSGSRRTVKDLRRSGMKLNATATLLMTAWETQQETKLSTAISHPKERTCIIYSIHNTRSLL